MDNIKQKDINALKKQMFFMGDIGEYAKALEILAEIINLGCRDADIIYAGAKNYFLLGDFERAGKWVDMALEFAPDHVEARLLLAKLLLMKNRLPEALALYDFVAKHLSDRLTAENRDEMKDILMFYATHQKYLVAFYPNVVDFLVREFNRDNLLNAFSWPSEGITV